MLVKLTNRKRNLAILLVIIFNLIKSVFHYYYIEAHNKGMNVMTQMDICIELSVLLQRKNTIKQAKEKRKQIDSG